MKSEYRVVVIGGGVVGASVLYHLAKFGWQDVCLIERSILTAGSSWHAAGGFHALNADPNIAALQAYTIDLFDEIEKVSGQDIGMHMTGGLTIATTPERWEWLQSAYRVFQTIGIEDCRLVTPEECQTLNPVMNCTDILGGLWADREGYLDTTGTVHAYAGAAKKYGAEVIEHTMVNSLEQLNDGWKVVTDKGDISCQHVVNAAGLWAKQVGRMAGIELPVSPLEHHYLITDSIDDIAKLDTEIPMTVDPDGFTYIRQDQQGMLVGIYELQHQHWMMDGAPWDYGIELLQENFDRIENELAHSFNRYPCISDAGIKTWVNGAFTFSPDGNPLVGPVSGKPGYWTACAVMAGFLQGGGVGKSLAEWMIYGEPEADIFGMDVARYGQFAENKQYIKETTGQFYSRRFVMSYPNEQLPAGRNVKMAPAYEGMTAAGCRWGQSWGLEIPLYFAPHEGFKENLTLKRSNAHNIVAAECQAVRDSVGMVDISAFSRFEVKGADAESWLNHIMASKLPAPGRAKLAPMLAANGKLKGDLTIFNWGDGSYWITGSYYLRAWHMRWFNDHLTGNVSVNDISDTIVGFAIAGPNARKVMANLCHQDVSNDSFKFMACQTMDVGCINAKVGRLSVCGELGYEIHCHAIEHIALRRALLAAGADFSIKEFGFNALLSLRIEKSFGIWSAEFTQGYTAGMTGMDRWIDWTKGDFIGKQAALDERNKGGADQRLITLEVEAIDADASGYEPIWHQGQRVGFVTSGAYGHTIQKSIAMALVDKHLAITGTELSVHIVGIERPCRVIDASPYDPQGLVMRR